MNLTPYVSLKWAFQLHYDLRFRTDRRRQLLINNDVDDLLEEICQRHNYNLPDSNHHKDHLRCLLSLRPEQSISKTVQIGRDFPQFLIEAGINQLWQPAAYACTCGDYTTALVKKWLDSEE